MIQVDSIAFKQANKDLIFNTVVQVDDEYCEVVPRGIVLLAHKRDDSVIVHCEDKLYTCNISQINSNVSSLLTETGITGRNLLGMLRAD